MEILELSPGDAQLKNVYPVIRELRTELTEEDFHRRFEDGYRDNGYRIAALFDNDECLAAAGYRVLTNFVSGRFLYIDDLVTVSSSRSKGYGKSMNGYLVDIAQKKGCTCVKLDSGVNRQQAHRFYFREGYIIACFNFGKSL